MATCLALVGSAVVGIGAATVVPGSAFLTSSANATAPAAPLPTLDSLLDARSPGERRYGWLSSTKNARYAAAAPGSPTERVLASVRRRPVPAVGPDNAGLVAPPVDTAVVPQDAAFAPAALGDPGSDVGFVPGAVSPGTGGFFPGPVGPGNSGGGSDNPGGGSDNPGGGSDNPGGGVVTPDPGTSNPGSPTPVDPTPVTPSVPEPATWAMLIAGFAMIGTLMRRRRTGFSSFEAS